MGAAEWVSGGVRRAVAGVRSAIPGQADDPEEASVDGQDATGTTGSQSSSAGDTPDNGTTDTEPAVGATGSATSPAAAPAGKANKADAAASGQGSKAGAARAPRRTMKKAISDVAAHGPAAGTEPAATGPAEHGPGWTEQELAAFRVALVADITRLHEELNMGEADLAEMLAHSDDGAGDDQADAGSKTLEREQEMSVANNARDLLDQSTHALQRLEAGTYGICESCGSRIVAARLRAFPRATLCITCKQAEERR